METTWDPPPYVQNTGLCLLTAAETGFLIITFTGAMVVGLKYIFKKR